MTTLVIHGPAEVAGSVAVPGDKSISHRALMLGAMATGRTTVRNIAPGDDVSSTEACLRGYGVAIERNGTTVAIDSAGIARWVAPPSVLDCGNSGTTMRVLAGLAAHRAFRSVFDGDESLRRRPMERVAAPLRALGAQVRTAAGGVPPLEVAGGSLRAAEVETRVASAQVKSSVLLAALGADGPCVVREPIATRDHTERMLSALGTDISWTRSPDGNRIQITPFDPPPFELVVAGDVSSAAFIVAAGVAAGQVDVSSVGLNASRVGFLDALRAMGAEVSWDVDEDRMLEPVGAISASRSSLSAISIGAGDVPAIHDELPLLAVLATQADGTTVVAGAGELRVKESDRIAATVQGLRRLGARIEERPDGFEVDGPVPLHGAPVEAMGDHRIAMAFAIAGLLADGETRIEGFECADVSWPGFADVLGSIGADVDVR